jgi:hypothetical protein
VDLHKTLAPANKPNEKTFNCFALFLHKINIGKASNLYDHQLRLEPNPIHPTMAPNIQHITAAPLSGFKLIRSKDYQPEQTPLQSASYCGNGLRRSNPPSSSQPITLKQILSRPPLHLKTINHSQILPRTTTGRNRSKMTMKSRVLPNTPTLPSTGRKHQPSPLPVTSTGIQTQLYCRLLFETQR